MKLTMLVALAVWATAVVVHPPAAVADSYSCAFSGSMGPIVPGIDSVSTDIARGNGGDSWLGPLDPLTDSDNGDASPDGIYHFDNMSSPAPSMCLAVDGVDEAVNDTGVYSATINSDGVYHNRICGTGRVISEAEDRTTIDLAPIAALGPGEDFADADYNVEHAAGSGRLFITSVTGVGDDGAVGSEDDESGNGRGILNLIPETGNCVDIDVTEFLASGAFTVLTN